MDQCETILSGLKELLKKEFSINHVTVQPERAVCQPNPDM